MPISNPTTKYTDAEAVTAAKTVKLDDLTAPDDTTDLDAAALHGLMPKADKSKLDGIEASADVTDATNVDAAGAVMEADFNAQTILAATTDDTPAALTVGEQTVVGRVTAGNVAALTAAQLTDIVEAATDTNPGKVELALAAEVNTGTSTALAVTPDALAGSIHGRKTVYIKVLANDTALTTGDGKAYFIVPSDLNGMNLVDADAAVYTVSSSGTPTIQIHNLTDASDMLSTLITIDASEFSSYTATTPPVIDGAEDDVVTGDRLRIDVDVAGTDTTGLDVILTFATP